MFYGQDRAWPSNPSEATAVSSKDDATNAAGIPDGRTRNVHRTTDQGSSSSRVNSSPPGERRGLSNLAQVILFPLRSHTCVRISASLIWPPFQVVILFELIRVIRRPPFVAEDRHAPLCGSSRSCVGLLTHVAWVDANSNRLSCQVSLRRFQVFS